MATVMQWTKRLLAKIDQQEKYAAPFERRYANEHILPFLAKEYAEVYPGLVVASADGRVVDSVMTGSLHSMLDVPKSGTAGIVVDALTERLGLAGITAPDDKDAAKKLEAAWEANDLDVMHHEGHRESLIASRAFASAARDTNDQERAVVGIESASQAAVERAQQVPYNVEAYLKVWTDKWTGDRAGLLRLPGLDYNLVESQNEARDPEGSGETSRWVVKGEPVPTGLTTVPVVELAPRARLLKDPVSEIAPIASLVDIVDLVEGLLVFAGHFGAVPIRYVEGLEVPRDPRDPSKPLLGADGKPMIGFNPRADHTWFGGKGVKFGQLEPAGLSSFVTWAEHASAKVRAKTALASTYFSLDLKSHMSAELLKTDEAPMVRRVQRMGSAGSLNQSWRRLGQYILAIESPSTRTRIRPRWEDPETRIESQLVDQFTKLASTGLGVRTVARQVLGWDEETIAAAVDEFEATRRQRLAEEQDPLERLSREFLGAGPALVG